MSLSIKCLLPKHEFWSLVHIQEARCSCVCLYTICLYIICIYTLCMSSIYCICCLYMTCLGTIVFIHYMSVLYMSIHYIALYQSRYYMMSMHYVSICHMAIHSSIYYIYTMKSIQYICMLYGYTLHVSVQHICLYAIQVYILCMMPIHYICLWTMCAYALHIYYIWYLYTYLCLYTLELGNQTDPWKLLASLANQWTPGSVKDTRKSDREGLLTLTSGLHTYTQIWKQRTSSCHTHKPALLGAVKVVSCENFRNQSTCFV